MSGRLRRAWLGGLAAALVVVVVALAGVGVGAAIPGLSGDRADRGEVTTTRDHPFFNASTGRYENLGSFGVGQRLSSARGGKPSFRGFVAGSSHITTAYNLTVAVDHTYHVGRQQILVHNTEGPCDVATGEAANTTARGWKVGDPIENLTKAGNSPAWSTVRARYWKNAANDALEGEYSASNLARMQAGKPPLHDELGVPMELNHIIPRWQGGGHTLDNLEPLWPWEHAAVDPFRFYTGPTP